MRTSKEKESTLNANARSAASLSGEHSRSTGVGSAVGGEPAGGSSLGGRKDKQSLRSGLEKYEVQRSTACWRRIQASFAHTGFRPVLTSRFNESGAGLKARATAGGLSCVGLTARTQCSAATASNLSESVSQSQARRTGCVVYLDCTWINQAPGWMDGYHGSYPLVER